MSYTILDKASLPGYIAGLARPMDILGDVSALKITEIGDGNLNYVFRVARADDPTRSIIVKQAVPYLRVAGEDWPLSRDRMIFEIRGSQVYGDLVPDVVPEIYHADEAMSVLIMQDLRDLAVLRGQMIEGRVLPKVGADIGHFMAQSLFRTSFLGMESLERRRLMDRFTLNDELCKLTEEFIFTFPFVAHDSNYVNPPTNAHALEKLGGDAAYIARVLHFKELFLSKTDALVHGDLHTGSIMAGPDATYVIDAEFAFFGPLGFDVGKIIANFLMCHTAHLHRSADDSYRRWLLGECRTIWTRFEAEFLRLWAETPNSALMYEGMLSGAALEAYKSRFMTGIFHDAVGFCACSIARRTVGIAGVADIRDIEDEAVKTRLEIMNIDLSHRLMMAYEQIGDIDTFLSTVEAFYDEQRLEA